MIQTYPIAAFRVFIADPFAARYFYNDVLGLKLKAEDYDAGYFIYEMNGFDLILEMADEEDLYLVGRFQGFSLKTTDIQADYERLRQLGVDITKPEKQEWGGTMLHFNDPEDNVFTLVQY